MSKTSDLDNNAQPDIAGYLQGEAPLPRDLEAEGKPFPEDDSMRDMEKSLVERIADVDDDRRRTAVQLQKAFNTHRDETTAALRRGFSGILAGVGVIALLLAGASSWSLWQQAQQRDRQAEALADLDSRLASLSANVARLDTRDESTAPPGASDDARQQALLLSELGGRVDELTALTAGLAGSVAELEGSSRASADDADGERAELGPLIDQQTRLAGELAALQTALAELPAQTRAAAETAAREIAAQAEQTTRQAAIDAARRAAEETLRDAPQTSSETNAMQGTAATLSAADLDRLIDEQLARLEREYQRLAKEVASPAVRQLPPPTTAEQQAPAVAAKESSPPPQSGPDGQAPVQPEAGQSTRTVSSQMSVGDRRYALQLIGFYSRDELDAFVADSPLPNQVYAREETFRGQPWFVLIHSLHPDLAAANAAQRALPPALAGLDIWIRDLPPETQVDVINTGPAN
jgi:DamX protein